MAKSEQSTTIDHILKYTGVFGGVQGLSLLISIIRNRLATTFLGAAGYGLIAIYNSISEFMGSIGNLGIPISSVRHLSELFENGNEDEVRHFVMVLRTWCLWAAIGAGLLCILFSPLLAPLFFERGLNNAVKVCLVAPMVMSLIITGGEVSILKGMRRLKRVALVSLLVAVSTFFLTVPFFWCLGTSGILLALISSTVMQTVIHLCFTLPIYPWQVALFDKRIAKEGWSVIRIGLPLVVTNTTHALMLISLAAIFTSWGGLEVTGFYKAGFTLMSSYAGMAFIAMESDFFPRLSSINKNLEQRNRTIDQQMRVNLLVMTPLLIALIMFMPLALHVLYASEFMAIHDMAIYAAFYTFLRCMTIPIAYLSLACGRTRLFLIMELTYNAAALLIMVGCYLLWGLSGIGIGISLTALFDLLQIGICYYFKFHFRFFSGTHRFALLQGLLLLIAVVCGTAFTGMARYLCCIVPLFLSSYLSLRALQSESDALQRLKKRLRR